MTARPKIGNQGAQPLFCTQAPAPRAKRNHGFTYIALLAAIVIIGISLGATGRYWSNVVLRDKE